MILHASAYEYTTVVRCHNEKYSAMALVFEWGLEACELLSYVNNE